MELANYQQQYHDFIIKDKHPCTMAQSIALTDRLNLHIYDTLLLEKIASSLCQDLQDYVENYDFSTHQVETFLAVFPSVLATNEISFEEWLWALLQQIHDLDCAEWDTTVSKDPPDANFSFSVSGKAFYIVGMQPNSSRMARQAPYTTIAFNLHHQFEQLREMNVYDKVRDRIRRRDEKLQGHINPVLENFGRSSKAKQYSGRQVDAAWKCPFMHKQLQDAESTLASL